MTLLGSHVVVRMHSLLPLELNDWWTVGVLNKLSALIVIAHMCTNMCVCLCACVCLGVFSAATKNSRNIMAPNLLSFKHRKERRKGQWYLLYIQMSNTLYVGSESCFTWTNRWKKFTAHTLQFVKLAFGGRLFIFVTLYILIQSQCRLARAEGKSKNFRGGG